ncbi:hypothetical protein [Aureibacter tunicatorum]|uniref:Uncharacterized protein n=1 Tax=Aureibacter tunicatorum TaxID=866807 RepID=A0AAE3XP90_9BACT|nr:hypothetical protein [Aureibacter tunicatorum]MDR6239534.1 hypothetical protein [Aureibacter tunicatorum]BDD04011.1 hypothetical protein AUTU_14940 [Aureibacter tunicatorum]
MKNQWFKCRFGYVNIDEENIYFTDSGIRNEALRLREKTKFSFEVKYKYLIYLLIPVVLGYLVFNDFEISYNWKVQKSIMVIFFIQLLSYAFRFLIFPNFKLPFNQIEEILVNKKSAEIKFVNGDCKKESLKIYGLNQQGIQILKALKFEKFA